MSSTTSNAERLLNQIVAARVRLSGLRGESVNTVDLATHDSDGFSRPVVSTEEDNLMSAPQPASEDAQQPPSAARETDDSRPVTDSAGSSFADEPFSVPELDQNTEVDFDFSHDPEIEDSLVLGIDPDDEPIEEKSFSSTNASLSSEDDPFSSTNASLSSEDDPFSFIDLIPPQTEPSAESDRQENRPIHEPPPVRPKPTMPLPTGFAAGAPKAEVPIDVPEVREIPREERPTDRQEPYQLHKPREVTPRILDPDRSVLEVDVYEDEAFEQYSAQPTATAPRLTEVNPSQPIQRRTNKQTRSEDDLFDTITEASTHLRHGNLRAARDLFGDVLDWIPSHLEARIAHGKCNRDLGDTVAALSDFRKAQQAQPHSPIPSIELGNLYFAKKDYNRAIGHYDLALEIDSNDAMTLCRRGICFHHRKRPERALEDLRLAQRINPDIPNIERYVRMVNTRR